MKYVGIITAAGLSSRMRDFKPLMLIGGHTMLENVVNKFKSVGVEDIVVVGGYKADLLKKAADALGLLFVENKDFASTGMFESLCLGINSYEGDCDGFMISPCDIPMVNQDTIELILKTDAEVIRPRYKGRSGHPVIISKSAAEKIVGFKGEDGLRGAIRELNLDSVSIDVDDEGILLDADTPEDFAVLRKLRMKQISGGNLWPEINIEIAKAGTILTPRNSQFLEMIDHTGSIQNASACLHMSYPTGWKLLNSIEEELGFEIVVRKSGGEKGGGSMLNEKGRALVESYNLFLEDVRNYAQKAFERYFNEE